jgi:hypothetical protein
MIKVILFLFVLIIIALIFIFGTKEIKYTTFVIISLLIGVITYDDKDNKKQKDLFLNPANSWFWGNIWNKDK